jgi:PAS domain S-box-containing protein
MVLQMLNCERVIEVRESDAYNILIVEDTKFISNAILKVMSQYGYHCEQAYSFEEIQEKLPKQDYDFILLDLVLPDASGYEMVVQVKKLTQAKILILTSQTDVEQREELYKLGILDYIVKDNYFNDAVADINTLIQTLEYNKLSTILTIDDSTFLQNQIKRFLQVRNYEVVSAHTAAEGYEKASKGEINAIILDFELPDSNGLELLRKMKQNPDLRHIPVIMLSTTNKPETVRDSLKNGAVDFLVKPFNVEELTLKVDLAVLANRQHKAILCEQKLLSEYKDVVDRSTIVSKTDPKGIITYVNDKFVEISGYSQEELIGKPHNIVRHPDMPKSTFKDMWSTIQAKKPWSGKVKNRKKDGGYYWVNTVINPIVDYDGRVIEYIGVRTDITDMENIKEELQSNLNISNKNFSQAYKISKEYQKAIDSSNIVSRADTKGNITYVNEHFLAITGYTKEELIGKNHRILKVAGNTAGTYKHLWETISSGKVWHGELKNKRKDGSVFYVNSTIVPIFDEDENIFEYMSITHDITEIVLFHQELEETQKEVIHKMGEVGESRSKETGYHVKRVAEYSKLLALLAGLGKKNAELLYSASPMHDIGKVGIPDSILKKPGKLTDEEFEIMKGHCEIGYNILKNSKRPILKAAAIVAYRHHEKWNGSGYPEGLAGEDIHIFGRITAIADVFDALGSDRCYKKAWELERILNLFKEEKGRHFDPKLTNLFLENIEKFLVIRDKYKDTV